MAAVEYHPNSTIEIPDGVPESLFRCAIPNTKRYMRPNNVTHEHVCQACMQGDFDALEEMLSTGDELSLFNGDVNAHHSKQGVTPLMMASVGGMTECVELLLQAKADPHVKERMPQGKDPADGRTALDMAIEYSWDDVAEILKDAEQEQPYGFYVPEGPNNNAKVYDGFQWVRKPKKGWYSCRPGVAERCGFDPMKYGTGPAIAKKIPYKAPAPAPKEKPAAAALPAAPAVQTVPVALLFPGQGSQYVKMLSGVKDIPAVADMLEKATSILEYDLLDLCLNGPEGKLEETRYCQPAMFVGGLAGIEKLRETNSAAVERPQCAAGLSLGEYTALCAAGVFTFEEGLSLVKLRGEAMQEAASVGKQAMMSVAGLEKAAVNKICAEAAAASGPGSVCQIANELFPKGFSCAGTEKAIHKLKELAEGAGALQAKLLKTSGAFHTSLMGPAQEKLSAALDDLLPNMKPPRMTVYMNVTSKPLAAGTDPSVIVGLMKKQLTSPVLWEPSCKAMIKDGVQEFYECGPMKQIKAMMKRIDTKVWNKTYNVDV